MDFSMSEPNSNRFSAPVTAFHNRSLPERATPVGYAALIDAFLTTPSGPSVPLPRRLSAIGGRHRAVDTGEWRLYSPRYQPQPTLEGHLTFALKYEGLDLAVLKRLFLTVSPADVEAIVRARPTGSYARRIWFLYEWLTRRTLDVPSAEMGTYVLALDPVQQWGADGQNSPRHRVRNNLPGTPAFCPLVFRTPALEEFMAMNLAERARLFLAVWRSTRAASPQARGVRARAPRSGRGVVQCPRAAPRRGYRWLGNVPS